MVNGLANDYGGGTIAVADWIPGQTKVGVDSASSIEPGSYIAIAQGATKETAVVRNVDYTNNFLTLDSALANTYPLTADVTVTTMEFTLTVTAPTLPVETFADLFTRSTAQPFPNIVSSATVSMAFADPPTTTPPTQNLPAEVTANLGAVGKGNAGVNEDPGATGPGQLSRR